MKTLAIAGSIGGVLILLVIGLLVATRGAVICLCVPCDPQSVSISGTIQVVDAAAPSQCRLQVIEPPQRDRLLEWHDTPKVVKEETVGAVFEIAFEPSLFVERYKVTITCPGFEVYESPVFGRRPVGKKKELGTVTMNRVAASTNSLPANYGLNPPLRPSRRLHKAASAAPVRAG
jgi:hypothetical protein